MQDKRVADYLPSDPIRIGYLVLECSTMIVAVRYFPSEDRRSHVTIYTDHAEHEFYNGMAGYAEALALYEARNANARRPDYSPHLCEHNVLESDHCDQCNQDYKDAAIDPENAI